MHLVATESIECAEVDAWQSAAPERDGLQEQPRGSWHDERARREKPAACIRKDGEHAIGHDLQGVRPTVRCWAECVCPSLSAGCHR